MQSVPCVQMDDIIHVYVQCSKIASYFSILVDWIDWR